MTEGQAHSDAFEHGRRPAEPDLAEALDHLLDPVGVVPIRPRARSRRREATVHAARTPQVGVELCRISYWRGYVKSQFVAVTDRDGRAVVVSTSPFFRVRGEPSSDDARARHAHAALRDELLHEGWEPAHRGDAWYESTFRRRAPARAS